MSRTFLLACRACLLFAVLLRHSAGFGADAMKEAVKEIGQAETVMVTASPAPMETEKADEIHFEEPGPPPHGELPQVHDEHSPGGHPRPVVAIIIDDMGYHEKIGAGLLALDMNLSFSFLPFAPFTKAQEQKAYDLGRDIMVHLPMEPQDSSWDPGKGALYITAEPDALATQTEQLLDMVPHAKGANNHMGSRFTEVREAMIPVLASLKKNDFFFVDSFTTSQSTALDQAEKMGIPATKRNVFLDNDRSPEKVCLQLEKLALLATTKGRAVGIGHPNVATLNGLIMCKDKHLADIDIVGIHQLVQ